MASLKRAKEARGPDPAALAAGLAALLALFAVTQYPDAIRIPFINDDYVFLEKTRAVHFASLWSPANLTFHWYRPWSRELHYWWLQRAFGANEIAFHAASLLLWLAVMMVHHRLARRVAGGKAAAFSTAGLVAMSAWAVPILWVAGVQDLWALLFCLLSLLALANGRVGWSAAAFAGALLSKETAAVLPGIALLFGLVVERRAWPGALRRVAPHLVLAAAWAAFHPAIGGRWWGATAVAEAGIARPALASAAFRTVAALVNLDFVAAPDRGGRFLARGIAGAAILLALVAWASRAEARTGAPAPAPPRGSVGFGLGWALLGWLPAFAPGVGWHAYYTLLGAMGAWLAIGPVMARAPRWGLAAIVALPLLRAAQADTPSLDWGAEWYQRRAGSFLAFMRGDLLRKQPEAPKHARFYFTEVPSNVGFLTSGGPALKVWYRDTTLSGGFYGDYRPRPRGVPAGPDLFFRYDSTSGFVGIENEAGDARARATNPRWARDHLQLSSLMARTEDWAGAARQSEMLAAAFPDQPEYALNAGVCYETMRDFARAGRWYAKVLASPVASDEDKGFARRFELRVRSAGQPSAGGRDRQSPGKDDGQADSFR